MADYTIISDVSSFIVRQLRAKMCPEPVSSPNHIEITSPADSDVDYLVGLYLYDISEECDISQPAFLQNGRGRMQKSPKPYGLHYMLYINSSSQMGIKGQDMQKIIGRAAQIFNDNTSILPNQLQTCPDEGEPPIALYQSKIGLEEKIRVWQAVNKPYQISLFYKAAPVFLSSELIIETPHVTEAVFGLQVKEEKGG